MPFQPFAMERWQSTYENRVAYNLSESGVHPLTVAELLELGGAPPAIDDVRLGYGQSNGSDELRARIAALYPGAGEANVLVTAGSAEANFVVMWRLVRPADAVTILLPAYMQTHGLAGAFGGRVREVHLREELGWQPDPDDISRAVGPDTRLIVVTNPNNPTGAILGPEPRAAVLQAARRSGAWILADEVYAGAELDGPETASFWGEYERVVATGSLSKAYGLPGLRIGWAAAPAELAAELWARTDYTSIAPALLSDHLAAFALRPDVRSRLIDRTRTLLRQALGRLTDRLDRTGLFRYRPPDAGAICFARYDLPIGSSDLAERLRVEQDVLVVPGDHFLLDGFLRFGYGLPSRTLDQALDRVLHLLAELTRTPRR